MKILVAGGTGFIGKALVNRLVEARHGIVLLTRDAERARMFSDPTVEIEQWDGKTVGTWFSHIDGADAVINLAGEPIVARRWTARQKQRIRNSRMDATRAVVEAMKKAAKKPKVLVNGSAVGYYGHVEVGAVTETHPKGVGFLPDLCVEWEQEAQTAESLGVRVVMLRTGIVLEKDGGALAKMLLPFKLFLGGPIGSVRQWLPCVHLEDVVRIVMFALENSNFSGPVNVAAPESVNMKQF
ncbi:MAG: TIGR01777 family oxidoreductase, partial [Ignavibacteria bacterium]|nr:TIGR01777 family oxidoreductase [Ignavibacteria bacterium]